VSVSFQFGDSTLFFESRFPADQLPAVTEIVTSVLISSGDPDATVSINGVKIELGILRRPPVIDLPNSDPHIAEMIRRNQWAFMLGNARWEIGMTFLFGDERVSFYARFASHLTPIAFITAKNILSLLATLNPNEEPRYYLQQVEPNMGDWRYNNWHYNH
jgi:hypothetical protein